MDYKGWVLSIYDAYQEEYDKIKEPKDKISKKFKDLELKLKIKVILFIVLTIIGSIMYAVGILYKKPDIYLQGIALIIIIPLLEVYTSKLSLDYYKNNIKILRKILENEGLNNEEAIKELIKETGGVFYKVKNSQIQILIKVIPSVMTTYILNKIDSEMIKLIIIIVILVWAAYTIWSLIPGGKIARRKKFNELLKITLFYKINSNNN